MRRNDDYGLTVWATSSKCTEIYSVALRQFQAYRGDPIGTIDGALAIQPDFVPGHIFRTVVCISMWERHIVPAVALGLRRLRELENLASAQERSMISALHRWQLGDWRRMAHELDRHLASYPRDVLALQLGHLADFYLGDRDNLRDRVARALAFWSDENAGYGFVVGMYAFGLEECGDYSRAEDIGLEALTLEPEDGWAHHALTHVREMQSRQEDGIAWMEARKPYWAQSDNSFAFHNWWHYALFNLDLDRIDRVLEIYDRGVRPGGSEVQLEMVDAAALLWRMHLRGLDVGGRWQSLVEAYTQTSEAGFYAFNDVHAMMTYAATGQTRQAERLLRAMEAASSTSTTNAWMTDTVGLAVARAIEAFGREAYADVVDLLMPVRYRTHAFGGSHAQRDIIHRTLLEAALRGGESALAMALAAERKALKPGCPFTLRQCERARNAHFSATLN